jgi:hypothetical protein
MDPMLPANERTTAWCGKGAASPETSILLTLLRESEYRAHVKEVNVGLRLRVRDLRMPPVSRPARQRSAPPSRRAGVHQYILIHDVKYRVPHLRGTMTVGTNVEHVNGQTARRPRRNPRRERSYAPAKIEAGEVTGPDPCSELECCSRSRKTHSDPKYFGNVA